MLKLNFSEKGLRLVSVALFGIIFDKKCFSCYILLTDQISLSDCLYFSRYWAICVLLQNTNLQTLLENSILCNFQIKACLN